jgi:uroporphyrinogen-III synthase
MEMIATPLPSLPLKPDAIAITSAHAVHALAGLPETWRELPVYTVGARTASQVAAQGYQPTTSHREGAAAMLSRLRETLPKGASVLYLSGDVTHIDLAQHLSAQGYQCERLTVYRALAIEKPLAALVEAMSQQRVIALTCFSARSAKLAVQQLQQAGQQAACLRLHALCFSAAIAEIAREAGFTHTRTADAPHDGAMLALAEQAIRAMA